jgi:hypothetical protein
MLRVPTEPLMRAHSFRIPACNKTGIRPTGRADQNFPGTRLKRNFFCHEKQETRLLLKANNERARIWLRGRDLNSRSRSRGIMRLGGASLSIGRTHRLLFVSSAETRVCEPPKNSCVRSPKLVSKVPCRVSTARHPHCAAQSCGRHRRTGQCKICYCDSEERKPGKLPAFGQKFGCGGEI